MYIAICDDDAVFFPHLKNIICQEPFFQKTNFCYYKNGKELKNAFKDQKFDFVFLDVDMPEENGIDAGLFINKNYPQTILIFVSQYPQYAIDAFDCQAFSYLLKNDSPEKYVRVIKKAKKLYQDMHKNILVKTASGLITLALNDIYYVESYKRCCVFYTREGTYTSVRMKLGEVLAQIENYGFYQVHQGYIVNFEHVEKIAKTDITLKNGSEIPLSERKRTQVINAYCAFVEERVP